MESYYFEGDASSVRHLFLGALMYSHPISDNLPTSHPPPPSREEPPLSLKHRAKLNLYEVYSIYRTNYTKLYKLYERLMGPKWKNDECVSKHGDCQLCFLKCFSGSSYTYILQPSLRSFFVPSWSWLTEDKQTNTRSNVLLQPEVLWGWGV